MTDRTTGAVTFLFTDLEDSTRLWDEHPDVMPGALAHHDELLRDAVLRHDGEIVKTTGDGLLAVSASPVDAALAASDALRALASEAPSPLGLLRVRVGIHSGAAEQRDGDYYGPALNLGARLMAAAHGGQIVVSERAAAGLEGALPDGYELIDLGEHRLRGLRRPERVFQLVAPGLAREFPPLQSIDAFPARVMLEPPSIARGDVVAGRDVELERLERTWQAVASDGSMRVVLIAGEPGIGKTRLAAEMARRVHDAGGAVLYGRSEEEAIVPYQPFVEALRPLIEATPTSSMHQRLHGLEEDLTRVFPELLGRIPSLSRSMPGDPDTERYRLFEAITALVTGATVTQPALLVLDDLHWADRPTLLLLRHVLRGATRSALLVLACYRDVELVRGHPLAEVLGDLRRDPRAGWISLHGLSIDESAVLLRSVSDGALPGGLAEALHRETGGNPLFLEELLRHLLETGAVTRGRILDGDALDASALDLPEGVRDVIVRRLQRLSDATNDVLATAAVIGSEADAVLVGRALGRATADVLQSLDEASDAGLVIADPAGLGRCSFAHGIIRQTVYNELGAARRPQLHAQVATALEESTDRVVSAAVLAYHFTRAMPLALAAKAIDYTARAGREAVVDLLFDEAVAFFERALDLLEQHAPNDSDQRVDLLIDRAGALVQVDERSGVEAALGAVHEARRAGSPAQLARAVIVFTEPDYGVFAYATDVAALLPEAVAALGDEHPALRARLLAIHAFKYASYQLPSDGTGPRSEAAVTLARESGDPFTLANALFARAMSIEGSPEVEERLELGDEMVELGRMLGASPWTFGLRVHARAHLELGEMAALEHDIAELGRIGTEFRWLPGRLYRAQWLATRALLEGRFDDVRNHADEMGELVRAYHAASGMLALQSFFLGRERGELTGVAALRRVADRHTDTIYLRALVASSYLTAGDVGAATEILDDIASRSFLREKPESGRPAGLALLAEVASVGGTAHAETLYELLEPFGGRLVVALAGLSTLGAADRYLGMLAAAHERWDAAHDHFERALELETSVGGRALLPRTRYWQARALIDRDAPGDAARAQDLIALVMGEARDLGMAGVLADAEKLAVR